MKTKTPLRTPHSTLYRYSAETIAAANTLPAGVVSELSHKRGMEEGEPLIVAMDCLIKYAEAYRAHFEQPLTTDDALREPWLDAAKGLRALLNGDGAIALARNITTDTKDNGCMESMFWAAMTKGGFSETDL